MEPERWRRLRPLLEAALDLETAQRAAFVAGVEADLHDDLVELLRQHADHDRALEGGVAAYVAPALARVEQQRDASSVGRRIGPYRIAALIGSGGMGAVYRAERVDGEFEQSVALKVIRGALAGPGLRERFVQERQILAQLKHPNIAGLLDGGETEAGEPYFTLEFVDGVPITEYCAGNTLGLDGRVKLLIKVAVALAHAHRNLVIHRDIKPSNILVEADGRVKLLDFGIAKLLVGTPGASLTRQAIGPMTPEYAAPEQFRRGPITVATDIYQFGVLAFRVLTGRLPYRADPDDPLDWARAVTEEEPLTLSRALTLPDGDGPAPALTEGIATDASALRRTRKRLAGDLNAIVHKALAKAPDARYRSMDALITDLDAFLEGRTVSARRASPWYAARRFAARHRIAVTISALAVVAVCAAAAIAIRQAVVARAAAETARVEADNAREITAFLTKLFAVSDPGENRGARLSANDILEQGAQRLDQELADNPLQRGRIGFVIGNVFVQMGEYRRAAEVLDKAVAWLESGHAGAIEQSKALRQRAFVASRFSEFDRARALLARAEAVLGAGVARTTQVERALVLATRATVLRNSGRLELAVGDFKRAIEITLALEGDKSSKLGAIYNNLGLALWDLGRADEAISALDAALAVYRGAYGDEHPRTLNTSANLAMLESEAGRYEQAIARATRVVDLHRRVLSGKGPQFGDDVNALGVVFYNARKFDQALAMFSESAQVFAAAGGTEQEPYAQAVDNMASCLLLLEQHARALELAQTALAIRTKVLGADHRSTRLSKTQIAQALLALGRRDEAYAIAQDAARALETMDPALRATVLRMLALCEEGSGQLNLAREHAMRGLAELGARPMRAPGDAQIRADLVRLAKQLPL